jgi:hypothetical protein
LERFSAEKKRRSPMPRRHRGNSGDKHDDDDDLDLALVDGATLVIQHHCHVVID